MPDRMELHCNLKRPRVDSRLGCRFLLLLVCARVAGAEQPANRWIELRRDERGARRGSAVRYVPDAHAFFLWGFFDDDPDLLEEHPLMEVPEYDMVTFDPDVGRTGRVGGMGLGHAFSSAARFRAASSGSVMMSIHFGLGEGSAW